MTHYVKAAELTEFSSGRSKRVVINETELALFFIKGKFYAIQNECPHQHYSSLHEGILNGLELTCPMHGWSFDLSTGKAIVGGGRLKHFAVKVEGNDVFVEAPGSEPEWALR